MVSQQTLDSEKETAKSPASRQSKANKSSSRKKQHCHTDSKGSANQKHGTRAIPDTRPVTDELPDFSDAKPSTTGPGHNRGVDDPSMELADLRRILVGPAQREAEERLEVLITILEEREADLVAREKRLADAISEVEETSAEKIRQIESEHDATLLAQEEKFARIIENVEQESAEALRKIELNNQEDLIAQEKKLTAMIARSDKRNLEECEKVDRNNRLAIASVGEMLMSIGEQVSNMGQINTQSAANSTQDTKVD